MRSSVNLYGTTGLASGFTLQLHREAFPLYYGSRPQVDHYLADHEISKEEKLSWVRGMVPEASMEESKK